MTQGSTINTNAYTASIAGSIPAATTSPTVSEDDLLAFLNPGIKANTIVQANDVDFDEWVKTANDGDMIVYSDGMYVLRKRTIGSFVVMKDKFKTTLPLYPTGKNVFVRNEDIPKIPGYLFRAIIQFYQRIYSINKNEVMAQIWWDKANQEYLVEVPEQEVAGASISYSRVGGFYDDPNLELVMTSHSHHTMGKYFSIVFSL